MAPLLHFIIFATHAGLTVFNLVGWMWKRTRRLHLLTIAATVASWFGLGLFYGFGYCPLTDWQWDLKRRMGETDLPDSFMKYYLDGLLGSDLDPAFVNAAVLVLALAALVVSVILNVRDRRRARLS